MLKSEIERKVRSNIFPSSTFICDKCVHLFNLTMVLDYMHCAKLMILLLSYLPQEFGVT